MAISDYLCSADAADFLNVSVPRIYQFVRDGRLPSERIGRTMFFPRTALEKFRKKPRKNGRPKVRK